MSPIYDDHILMGDIAYNFLLREVDSLYAQDPSDFPGCPPFSEDIYGTEGPLNPTFDPTTSPSTMSDFLPPLSPSSSCSEASSSPEYYQTPPEPRPTSKPSCLGATPDLIEEKWYCSLCNESFRGKWECERHINAKGKQSMCLACGKALSSRNDSLKRHFTKHCKGNVEDFTLEDAFVGV